jgi:cytochrome P450
MSATRSHTAVPVVPGRLPLLGHALAFRKDPVRFLTNLREHGGLVKMFMGPLPVVAVTSPELVYQMLVTDSASYDKGRLFDKLQRVVGNGVLTSNGTFHREQRRLMQPAFQRKMVARYAEVMRARTEEMVAVWQPGQVVNVQRAVDDLALGIGVSTLFTSTLSTNTLDVIKECLPVMLNGVLARTVLPDSVFRLPAPVIRRMNLAEQRLRASVDEIIRTYRADGEDHGDLLTVLLTARDEDTGRGMTDEQVRDELVTLMLAAAETTSSVLASLFCRLAQNPVAERKVLAEIDGVLAGRAVGFEVIPSFDYLGRVLNEVLRLDVPGDLFMRRAITDVTLGDTLLPAGTEFLYSIPSLHRNPEFYPDPDAFDPDRWLRRPARELPRGSYIPFSIGSRGCLGQSFAWTELNVIATTVLSRWRLSIEPGVTPVQRHHVTTHFTNLTMVVEQRTDLPHHPGEIPRPATA